MSLSTVLRVSIGSILLAAALIRPAGAAEEPKKKVRKGILLQSSSFQDGRVIPPKYTCDGENLSPALSWANPPAGTKYFALICEDPDAPMMTWVHWVIYNIPARFESFKNTYQLLEGFPKVEKTKEGILQGSNDFKKIGYDGPCPPEGLHRYYFKLYALDAPVKLPAGASKTQLLKAMEGHILGWTQIMGAYGRLPKK